MQDVYSVNDLTRILSPIFKNHSVKYAVLFGSYAKGVATPRSDVDILVDSGLRGLAFWGLLEDVSSALAVPVDLIDVVQVDKGSRIEQEIEESGIEIYTA